MRPSCGAAAALILAFVGYHVKAGDARDDLKALQGTWDLIYFERDGKEVKLQEDTKVTCTGGRFVVKRGDRILAAGRMKLDPSKRPKASETTYSEGPDKGKTFQGIDQFDGNKVKFCRAGSPDEERPTDFSTRPGSGRFVAVYRRAKEGP